LRPAQPARKVVRGRTRLCDTAVECELKGESCAGIWEMEVEENLERGISELEATCAAHRDLGVVFAVREAHHPLLSPWSSSWTSTSP